MTLLENDNVVYVLSSSEHFSMFFMLQEGIKAFLINMILRSNGMIMLQLLVNQLEPLTEQQLVGITNLQQSSQQAEDALSQGMEALQQSLAETLSSGALGSSGSSGNVANYMGQMAMAMGKLGTLEGFIRQVSLSTIDILYMYVYSFLLVSILVRFETLLPSYSPSLLSLSRSTACRVRAIVSY